MGGARSDVDPLHHARRRRRRRRSPTSRRCCSAPACSRRRSRSTTRSRATSSRSGGPVCSRGVRPHQPPGRAVHRLAGPDADRGRRRLHLLAVRQRPGPAAVHLADEPRRARRDRAARARLVRDRRLLQPQPARGDDVDVALRPGDRRRAAHGDLHPRAVELQHADHRARPTPRATIARSSCRRS